MFTETVAHALYRWLGVVYLVIAFGLMGAVPLYLLAQFIVGLRNGYGPRFGLFLGFLVAIWGSLCWILVPYCGGYPNIPGLVIGGSFFGVGTWGQEISVHVTNLLLWPLMGWALFGAIGRSRPRQPPLDQIGMMPRQHPTS
ncbi:MAG: hypothetical protein P4L85_27955 [Paludisphaera borealis]|uniref:hypothetical protein n=1 Tax=Paludisphaera borealis TaxID=1387353 RepID=UPI002841A427|nr:hypothetical protein [Paludisphaera borealis]MDR3623220.1 hypothetical protein [Paludisphaera borealis]